ncbi:OmpA family protein [Cellulomonas soli]|uniref:OmpA-like domain-containing protein n=1 Tax=Cellulomonas soli TaxID=931535 RepID=A0A512PC46_9CELL|nr:OmpA family protein [Cellulomonas soli]NYI58315.1 outer membrane protein OmpA-like peptidoglycan-associated protein [Cellulomonas soli]GEP68736.1 hypothetical protein CSO01_14510 [Cellulomonas soli]
MQHVIRRPFGSRTAALLVGLVVPVLTAAPSVATGVRTEDDRPDPLAIQTLADLGLPAEPSPEVLRASVLEYVDLDGMFVVHQFSTDGAVRPLETVEHEASETVVTLASDILFTSDSAELSEPARSAIGALVAEVPQGASLAVHGHTDSVDTEEHNLVLSQSRAQAVAAVIAAVRPDLVLDVVGLGESQPAVAEQGEDVGAARATNRRVELRYAG